MTRARSRLRQRLQQELASEAADPERARQWLLRSSLLTSVREQELCCAEASAFERTTMRGGGGDLAVRQSSSNLVSRGNGYVSRKRAGWLLRHVDIPVPLGQD